MDSTAADRFVIEGGHPFGGEVIPTGNKNEALPLLAASLLAPGNVVIENVPRIRDVTTLIELVRALGVSVTWSAEHAVTVDAGGLRESRPDAGLAAEIRASFLLAAEPGSPWTTRTIGSSSRGASAAPRSSSTRPA